MNGLAQYGDCLLFCIVHTTKNYPTAKKTTTKIYRVVDETFSFRKTSSLLTCRDMNGKTVIQRRSYSNDGQVSFCSVRNAENRPIGTSFNLPSCDDGELSWHILDNR